LDKPEYVVPQENSGDCNNTITTDAEVPTKTTSDGISIEELIKDPKLINKRVWQLAWPAMVELLLSTLFSMVETILPCLL